jgi:thiol:disulfide interchange protein
VELEISLDETREQYNNVLRTSNNRAQQKKMMFLERNLDQLTNVQRQLVEQNSSLKKEVAIAERKLIARNERIQSLEALLQDSQEKLTAANHRYVEMNSLSSFDQKALLCSLLARLSLNLFPCHMPRLLSSSPSFLSLLLRATDLTCLRRPNKSVRNKPLDLHTRNLISLLPLPGSWAPSC